MQQAALFRRERQVGVVNAVLELVCVNQRDTSGVLLCGLIEYACVYSPADSADHAEECSRAALFRRERQVGCLQNSQ